ncbi:DUF945 domain-containing protein [Caminibacter mediatlanticus TB-2]|uniref:DUF945 domain-containing protein n=1 Tax=Caminibacter mediatlanticus TB-2 TaxID=391592 RepID=A0ABX5V822_9BACT|nr:DUF945 domain-containing protein [Caminibacter mediatlanticus]QCT94423.1 DUF945 domain-containing protein [Caminibacter mediatlanticus TB-2]
MKNRLIVFIATFLIMVLITPFVFSKLMNSKFDKMLDNLKKSGIEIKEVKNKSSYILTDRVFLVKVPGKTIDEDSIEYIEAQVESKFKNLPVTDVKFFGDVKKIVFKDEDLNQINPLIKDKIKFLVITPNFKTYKYKIFDNNISDKSFVFKFKGINGIYNYPNNENNLNIQSLILSIENRVKFEANNFKSYYKNNNYQILSGSEFNFSATYLNNKFLFDSIKSDNKVFISDKAKAISKLLVKNINFNNQLILKNNYLDLNLSNIDYKTIQKLRNTNDKKKQEELLKELVTKGLKANLKFDIKDIEIKNQKLGFINLYAKLNIKPDDKLFEKLENKDLEDINLSLKLKTTPKIATILAITNPVIGAVFMNAKQDKNGVLISLDIKEGKIFLNGKEIKSN